MGDINNQNTPLVAIRCITYNQESYIRDALDGFVMQKTNFPFVAIVHDDASTDATADIIREYVEKYPDIIKPIYENENQYSKPGNPLGKIMYEAIESTGAKYVAICEGDDYWIDSYKLQKQVDFLESHPDYSLVYTNFNIYIQNKNKVIKNVFDSMSFRYPKWYNTPEEFIIRGGYTCPPSWMIRSKEFFFQRISSCDGSFVMFTHFLCTSKVYCLDETMVVYRVLRESASHSTNYSKLYKREKELLNVKKELIKTYNLDYSCIKDIEKNFYNSFLSLIFINEDYDEIKKAQKILDNLSLKQRIIIFMAKLKMHSFFKFLIKLAYK